MSETTNLPSGESDSARPSISIDDAADLEIYDPEEDNVEPEPAQQSEIETDEAEPSQEAEETPSEDDEGAEAEDEGAEDAANPEPKDDVTVTVNGEQVALSDLKAGYMKEKDYRHKTTEVANQRKGLEAMSARVQTSVNAIAEFLINQIPAEPDPQLAMTDPAQFVQAKAMHEAAMAQVNALLSQAGEVKTVANTLTSEQRRELLLSENARLAEEFPQTATDEGRQKFFNVAVKAAKDLGYSDDEIAKVVDHRTFALAYYADIGMRAEKAREKAKQKVTNVPPVAPQKARPHGGNQAAASRNRDAMKRLARSGSLDDALSIDFD